MKKHKNNTVYRLLLITIFILVPQSVISAEGSWKAFIISIGDYRDARITDLRTPVIDGEAIADVLSYQYGFEVTRLFDEEATWEKIDGGLRQLIANSSAEDSILIYYGGHGDLDRELGEGWWYPYDTVPGSRQTYLQNNHLRELIKKMEARHVLLVSDSCFAASLFGDYRSLSTKIDDRYHERLYQGKSRLGLTSGGKEPVLDGGSDDHSIFAYHLLNYLNNTEKKVFSVGELFSEIAPVVTNNSPQKPEFLPILYTGHESGEFVFVRNGTDIINYVPTASKDSKEVGGSWVGYLAKEKLIFLGSGTAFVVLMFLLLPKVVHKRKKNKLHEALLSRDFATVKQLAHDAQDQDPDVAEEVLRLLQPVKGLILDNIKHQLVIGPGPRQGLGRGQGWPLSLADPHISRKPHGWLTLSDAGIVVTKDGGSIVVNGREEVSQEIGVGDEVALGQITTLRVEKHIPGSGVMIKVDSGPEKGKQLAMVVGKVSLSWLTGGECDCGNVYWQEDRPFIELSERDNHPLSSMKDQTCFPLLEGDVLRIAEMDWMVKLI